jgi:hypothetical protein
MAFTEMWERRYACVSCRIAGNGAKSGITELAVPEVLFANRLSTARGRGFGLGNLSSEVIRIPQKTRKKATITVETVITFLFLIIYLNMEYFYSFLRHPTTINQFSQGLLVCYSTFHFKVFLNR